MAAPVFRSASAKAAGTGAVTPALPAGVAANDLVILVATTIAGGSLSITAPGSIGTWTALPGSPIDVAGGERLYVWWGRYASGSTGPTVTPASDHCCAATLAYSGVNRSASPLEAVATGTETTSDTTFSFATGVSTTGADRLVLAVCSTGADSNTAQGSSEANAALTNVVSRANYCTNSGGGGGFDVIEGLRAAAGSTGTFTATLATATPKAYITFALIPLSPVTVTPGVGSVGASAFLPSIILPVVAKAALASLLAMGRAPSVALPITGKPGVASVAAVGSPPTVVIPTGTRVQPATGQLTASGVVPGIRLPVAAKPGAALLQANALAPILSLPLTLRPAPGQLGASGVGALVLLPVTVRPGLGVGLSAGLSPQVLLPGTLLPGAGALRASGHAPTIGLAGPAGLLLTPGMARLLAVAFRPGLPYQWYHSAPDPMPGDQTWTWIYRDPEGTRRDHMWTWIYPDPEG